MADGTVLNSMAGGDKVDTEDMGSRGKIQRMKLVLGNIDTDGGDVYSSNPLPTTAVATGNVAAGTTDSGNGVKISGVYHSSAPILTDGQRGDAQLDVNSNVKFTLSALIAGENLTWNVMQTQAEGQKPTYSAAITGLAIASAATDVFTIFGSASKTVRITRISVGGVSTSISALPVLLIKRSTADSSGVSTSPTMVAHDSNDAAATASVAAYTANPTLGSTVGTMQARRITFTTGGAGVAEIPNVFDFENRGERAIVLRGTAQGLAINLNGASIPSGLTLDIDITWSEE